MKTGQNYRDTSVSGYMYHCLIILMLHVKKHWAMIYHQQPNYQKRKSKVEVVMQNLWALSSCQKD